MHYMDFNPGRLGFKIVQLGQTAAVQLPVRGLTETT